VAATDINASLVSDLISNALRWTVGHEDVHPGKRLLKQFPNFFAFLVIAFKPLTPVDGGHLRTAQNDRACFGNGLCGVLKIVDQFAI